MIEAVSVHSLLEMAENFGGTVDFEKKTFSIEWGKFKLKNIPFPYIRALSKDQHKIDEIISALFATKEILWADLRKERVKDCIISLKDLINKVKIQRDVFIKSSKESDTLIASQLLVFHDICVFSLKQFNQAIVDSEISRGEADPSDSWDPEEEIPDIVLRFRIESYPIVKWFASLLKDGRPTKERIRERLNEGEKLLIKLYNAEPKEIVEQKLYED